MESFRTVYEHEVAENKILVQKDLIELGDKIAAFREGKLPEDKFRSLRLARGIYGQRQQGVQMIRIKLPYGKVSTDQLRTIADVSDEYSTGKLHITTRQDVQIHHVSLDRTPQLWADLEKSDVTLREACGNTVRNVTAGDLAGINPNELFDVTPYADSVFRYFLRKSFGQELGRKIKIAFSSDDTDDAFTFMHDFGFIPRVQEGEKGFKVVIGGGLGAQPFLAHTAFEFLPVNSLLPFLEASVRVFDRHGERNSRNKARMKYLIAKIGLESFLKLVEAERHAVQFNPDTDLPEIREEQGSELPLWSAEMSYSKDTTFNSWVKTNVFPQKQAGFVAVYIHVPLGDFTSRQARELAKLMEEKSIPEMRFTISQNIQLRFVNPEQLLLVYETLKRLNLHQNGFNSLADITACPGTDTCNLGISNSTEVALELESFIRSEYPGLIPEAGIRIKISGCMNACGQHSLAQIGFHGSSIKTKVGTLPALQVLLGGGVGRIAEKVIKIPSKRVLKVIQFILNDYLVHHETEEDFAGYYDRQGNHYFYQLLKPLADLEYVEEQEYLDWGQEQRFSTAIGVGECAGVILDLAGTLLLDAEEKRINAQEAWLDKRYADAFYFSYSAGIHAAKAALIRQDIRCNTHQGIIQDFEDKLAASFGYEAGAFSALMLQIREERATVENVKKYMTAIVQLIEQIKQYNK